MSPYVVDRFLRRIWLEAPTEIVDYLFLMECLKDYKKPRSKLSSLLKAGVLIRIKKGLYVIGKQAFVAQGNGGDYPLYSREMLANLIYGPSYISLEFALAYYDLIPERVEEVTSMTCSRNKKFNTPLGRFNYHYLRMEKYPVGVTYAKIDEKRGFLIATKEKALADLVARHSDLKTQEDMFDYIAGLRIEPEDLKKFSLKKMREISNVYKNHQVDLLNNLIIILHHEHGKRSTQSTAKRIQAYN
jgi:hypothetical protein